MTKWSIEKELCDFAASDNLSEALYKLKIIEDINIEYKLLVDNEWERKGSETYIYTFSVAMENHQNKKYILKAIVPFSPGKKLEEIAKGWINRRNVLSKNGIKTPHLYAFHNATILEEFIPYELREIIFLKKENTNKILVETAFIIRTVVDLGFWPIEILSGLRSRGDDAVVVDFGEDLGPFDLIVDRQKVFENFINDIKKLNFENQKDIETTILNILFEGDGVHRVH